MRFHAGIAVGGVSVMGDDTVILDYGGEGGEEVFALDDPLLTTRLDTLLEQTKGFVRQVEWLREQVSTGALSRKEA